MYPEWKKGVSSLIGEDTGGDQDAEMYLYQQKQAARAEKERKEKAERAEKERKEKREKNAKELSEFGYRFYHRDFKGKNALVAAIIDKKHNPPRADYGVTLIEGVISKLALSPPVDLSIDEIMTKSDFRTAVLHGYDEEVKRTDGKTDTQLGLHADHYTQK